MTGTSGRLSRGQHNPRRTPKRELTTTLVIPPTMTEKGLSKPYNVKLATKQVRSLKKESEEKAGRKIKMKEFLR